MIPTVPNQSFFFLIKGGWAEVVVGKLLLIKITKGENEGPEKVLKATSQ